MLFVDHAQYVLCDFSCSICFVPLKPSFFRGKKILNEKKLIDHKNLATALLVVHHPSLVILFPWNASERPVFVFCPFLYMNFRWTMIFLDKKGFFFWN